MIENLSWDITQQKENQSFDTRKKNESYNLNLSGERYGRLVAHHYRMKPSPCK
jgi:hypothetical protein